MEFIIKVNVIWKRNLSTFKLLYWQIIIINLFKKYLRNFESLCHKFKIKCWLSLLLKFVKTLKLFHFLATTTIIIQFLIFIQQIMNKFVINC